MDFSRVVVTDLDDMETGFNQVALNELITSSKGPERSHGGGFFFFVNTMLFAKKKKKKKLEFSKCKFWYTHINQNVFL